MNNPDRIFEERTEEEKELLEKLKNPPQFTTFDDNFAKEIAEAGIKAAKATHEFNMKEIKARLIADLCKELVKTPMRYEDIPQQAREIADKALENL